MGSNFHAPYTDGVTTYVAADMNTPMSALDAAFSKTKNVLVYCDGDITLNDSTGELAWSGALGIVHMSAAGDAIRNTAIAGAVFLAAGDIAYIDVSDEDAATVTVATAALATDASSQVKAINRVLLGYRNTAGVFFAVALRNQWNAGDQQLYRGTLSPTSYTNNGNGTITVGDTPVVLYDNAGYTGVPKSYTLTGGTFEFTNNAKSYLAAVYNLGSPEFQIITDVNLFAGGDYAFIFTTYRADNDLCITPWDALGAGAAEKVIFAAARTIRYLRESGLALSESGIRNINVSSGVVYVALAVRTLLDAVASAIDNFCYFKHVAGVWVLSYETQYGNTHYDDGTGLVEASPNQYIVQWVWRSVSDEKKIAVITGSAQYSLAEALASTYPTPPEAISAHCMLVGRIIVQKDAITATVIQSAFVEAFGTAVVGSHADLIDLQGGTAGEYYHLTQAEYAALGGGAGGVTVGSETSAAIIELDWSDYDVCDVTLDQNAAINATGGTDGNRLMLRLRQDATGTRVPVWGSMFRFSTDVPEPTISTAASAFDRLAFEYCSADARYDLLAVNKGY